MLLRIGVKAGLLAAVGLGAAALLCTKQRTAQRLRRAQTLHEAAASTQTTALSKNALCATVLIWCQHVRGIGHLKRTLVIAKAMVASGLRVVLASGGPPVPELVAAVCDLRDPLFRFVQLPPTHIEDEKSWQLLDETGKPITEAWQQRRRDLLLDLLRSVRPAAVLVELFPFGRRKFHFELEPLLDACFEQDPRPAVLSSVRDVLVVPYDGVTAQQWAADKTLTYFDAVLVHGDSDLISFDLTFAYHAKIKHLVSYTGYVVDAAPSSKRSRAGAGEVLVSAGGGQSGDPGALFHAAAAARALCKGELAACTWRFLVGWCVPEAQFLKWKSELACGGVVVERARADFQAMLASCLLSISQGGYNTVVESLHARTACVVVPLATPDDEEQLIRARILHNKFGKEGRFQLVDSRALSAEALAAAAATAVRAREQDSKHTRGSSGILLDGAGRTAQLVSQWVQRARSRVPAAEVPALEIAQSRADHKSGDHAAVSLSLPASLSPAAAGAAAASPAPVITVLLLHYRREENVLRILGALATQTVRAEVFLWNNSGRRFVDERVHWQVDSAQNRFCWPRWFMGSLARSEFVLTLDDDLMPGDDRLLEELVRELRAERDPSRILGFTGCALCPDASKKYKDGFQVNANKFPWEHAHELRWQEGLVYSDSGADSEPAAGATASGQQEAAAVVAAAALASPVWRKKPHLFDPPWLPKQKAESGSAGSAAAAAAPASETKAGVGESSKRRRCTAVAVDVVKGRLMALRTSALRELRFAFGADDIRGDDIAVSGMLAAGRVRVHRVSRVLAGRMVELPAPHALCQTGAHYERREAVRRRFFFSGSGVREGYMYIDAGVASATESKRSQ